MMETVFKKSLDISKKSVIVNNDEVVKVPRNVFIETLKTIKGLERKLQKQLSGDGE